MKTIINKLFKTITLIDENINFLGKYYISTNNCNTNTCLEIAQDRFVDVVSLNENDISNDLFAKIITARLFQVEGVTGILLSDNSIEIEVAIYGFTIHDVLEDCKMIVGSVLNILEPQKKEIDALISWASELIKKR